MWITLYAYSDQFYWTSRYYTFLLLFNNTSRVVEISVEKSIYSPSLVTVVSFVQRLSRPSPHACEHVTSKVLVSLNCCSDLKYAQIFFVENLERWKVDQIFLLQTDILEHIYETVYLLIQLISGRLRGLFFVDLHWPVNAVVKLKKPIQDFFFVVFFMLWRLD